MPRYVDLPKKFRYDKAKKKWIRRQARSEDTVIGRVHTVNPLAGETFSTGPVCLSIYFWILKGFIFANAVG